MPNASDATINRCSADALNAALLAEDYYSDPFWLNTAARKTIRWSGFGGDDHRPTTFIHLLHAPR